jgi:hypothetical protein
MRLVVQEAVGAGVSQLPGKLGGGQAQIEGHEDGAGAGYRMHGDNEGGAVAREHTDHVSRLHAFAT